MVDNEEEEEEEEEEGDEEPETEWSSMNPNKADKANELDECQFTMTITCTFRRSEKSILRGVSIKDVAKFTMLSLNPVNLT
ncbi:hypothetical protein HZH66_002107 [Vespula vulgaris]|uniref:Uncharacterized protein n=1 Tax=Vespula vulgaris TaxID=7454 RepID=A0A834NFX3_VESVU|nr:hypothetical protein HZH66_002107 [Vespula vulgaris]